jgi:hypothetical protein
MEDADRRHLYLTLLNGLADNIRNAPGSCDVIGHDWSPWHRTALRPDIPFSAIPVTDGMVRDSVVHIKAERRCHLCGLEQVE